MLFINVLILAEFSFIYSVTPVLPISHYAIKSSRCSSIWSFSVIFSYSFIHVSTILGKAILLHSLEKLQQSCFYALQVHLTFTVYLPHLQLIFYVEIRILLYYSFF